MKLQTKITLGYLTLFLFLVIISSYGLYHLKQLDRAAQNILKDNLLSVKLGKEMSTSLDQLHALQQQRFLAETDVTQPSSEFQRLEQSFASSLQKESTNLTEPGESDLVRAMQASFAAYKSASQQPVTALYRKQFFFTNVQPKYELLREQIDQMVSLNLNALMAKNKQAQETAAKSQTYTITLIGFIALFSLMFLFSVPEAFTKPLQQVLASIKEVSQKNYNQKLYITTNDEFGAIADAFNTMLQRLQAYEKSTLAELITEKNRMDALVANLDEGLLLLNADLRVILANPTAERLFSLPRTEWVGQRLPDLASKNDLFAELQTALQQAGTAAEKVLTVAEEAEEQFYNRSVFPVVSYNEVLSTTEFTGHIVTYRNVSEYKRLDLAKSNFLALVSHELKTPLASIGYSVKLLQDERIGQVNTEQQSLLQTVKVETSRLQKLVGELLEVSRMESGNIALNLQTVNLVEVLQYSQEIVKLQLLPKNIRLHLEAAEPILLVQADVEKTTWVLVNLLNNAIRYSAQNETITLGAFRKGNEAVISVQDNGPGIEEAHHERIFHKFAQIPSKAEYKGGAGLGLSISREFIQAQQGRIWVESSLGKGSTFYVSLPLSS